MGAVSECFGYHNRPRTAHARVSYGCVIAHRESTLSYDDSRRSPSIDDGGLLPRSIIFSCVVLVLLRIGRHQLYASIMALSSRDDSCLYVGRPCSAIFTSDPAPLLCSWMRFSNITKTSVSDNSGSLTKFLPTAIFKRNPDLLVLLCTTRV